MKVSPNDFCILLMYDFKEKSAPSVGGGPLEMDCIHILCERDNPLGLSSSGLVGLFEYVIRYDG